MKIYRQPLTAKKEKERAFSLVMNLLIGHNIEKECGIVEGLDRGDGGTEIL